MYNPNNELKSQAKDRKPTDSPKVRTCSKTFYPATRRIRQIDEKFPFRTGGTILYNDFGNPSDAENIKNKKLK